jgi:hypothetical protein
MLYLYGITWCQADFSIGIAGIAGIDGFAVEMVPCGDLVAAASPIETREFAATEENLWRHEHVIEAIMAINTVLPLRFGTVAADAAACRHLLSQSQRQLCAQLTLLKGRVEFGLRLDPDAAQNSVEIGYDPVANRPGTHYLQSLARTYASWPASLEVTLYTAFDAYAVAYMLWPRGTLESELRASFLVEKSEIYAFRQAVAKLQSSRPEWRISCTGPWPPYSFVESKLDEKV